MPDAFPGHSEIAAALRNVSVFRTLPDAALAALAARMWVGAVADGDTVIAQNASGAKLYVVLSGSLTVTYSARHGVERSLPDVPAGETFSEISAVMDAPATATARAGGDT